MVSVYSVTLCMFFVCNEGKGVMVRMVKEGGVGVY